MAKKRLLTSPAALYRIEKRLTPQARAAFLAAVKQWKADVKAGKPPKLAALAPLVTVTADGMRLAGIAAAAQIGGLTPGLTIAFNLTNPAAVKWAKANAARLIKDISSETAEAIRKAIVQSMRGDLTVQEVAKFVRSRVGLTVKMNEAVQAFYERALESGYTRADALDEMYVYTEKLIRHRSEVIARTEVLRAENAGQGLLWEQSKAAGGLRGLVKMWLATPDEITCAICGDGTDGLNRQLAEIGESWHSEVSGEDYDRPPAHPQCRCSAGLVRAT